MKIIQMLVMVGILFLAIGCQTKEVEETVNNELVVVELKGLCALTAIDEEDGKFLMVDKLFSEGISCDTNDDCYNFLLEQDDFRSLAPEFKPHLSCEEEAIAPNQI